MENSESIIIYGTSWCGDTRRARAYFSKHNIPYQWIDIDFDAEGGRLVEELNHGYRSVPTIIFPDGSTLVEPSNEELDLKFFPPE